MCLFGLVRMFQLSDLTAIFWSIDVPMMSVLQYVTVLNRLFDGFSYFAPVFLIIGVDLKKL